jgi:SEC-C motif-containing protein
MIMTHCYCGLPKTFSDCCQPIIEGLKKAVTAEALMRSRYSAYSIQQVDYLIDTTHNSQRKYYSKAEILKWSSSNKWLKLEIINTTELTVEFKAYFLDSELRQQIHHEFSHFVFENESWFYVDGKFF